MKKYELLLLSRTLRRLQETADILQLLNELLAKLGAEKYYMSFELTLLVYNIVLNNNCDFAYFFDKHLAARVRHATEHILQQLYKSNKLTPEQTEKISADITYIQEHKQYTYIPDIAYIIYFFFV